MLRVLVITSALLLSACATSGTGTGSKAPSAADVAAFFENVKRYTEIACNFSPSINPSSSVALGLIETYIPESAPIISGVTKVGNAICAGQTKMLRAGAGSVTSKVVKTKRGTFTIRGTSRR